jgi:hypothetical protein
MSSRRALAAVLLLCALSGSLALEFSPAEATTITCKGRPATIIGTSGPDVLRGTRGDDVIAGQGGDDTIVGGGGDDIICGGPGRDTMSGGSGRDLLLGGPAADVARGGENPFGPGDSCDAEQTSGCEAKPVACVVGSVPASLGLDPFYRKHCQAAGLPVVTSRRVAATGLRATARIVDAMLSTRPDIARAMAGNGGYVMIMSIDEVTTDVPEHRFLADDPFVDWDTRARGLGGTLSLPLTSAGEENVSCLPWGRVAQWTTAAPIGDPYFGESILVHEFAHSIHLTGLVSVDPGFQGRLDAAYANAMSTGLWANTYSATNSQEYWAVGVQAYFQAAADVAVADGVRGPINTRSELRAYDRRLFTLIDGVFRGLVWQPDCVPTWRGR